MAFRTGIIRRFLFSSTPNAATTAAAAAAANSNPPSTTLFVSGLNKRTTSEKLQEEFSKFGEVVHARVVTDRGSGYSKGFGFVKYSTLGDAEKGMKGMDAQMIDDQELGFFANFLESILCAEKVFAALNVKARRGTKLDGFICR
ncbi:hypothetical protein RJ640_014456 [Escallonia rubra]|uniref:RRM domain-containing protein n=1 Tax=Escallonia rubra TaxID=112253 RepID=A0AA88QQA4_9ASTE|nr:hypothetical protein RJ640_014456 [Escallonia rubra]